LVSPWVMWSVSSVATAPGSMTMTRTSGWSSWRRASDQPLRPPLRRGVGGVAGTGCPPGNRGDVHEVAAAAAELIEEDLGGGHRAEEVDLDHLALLGALVGRERGEQHHAGVVHQDVGAAELIVDALGRGDERVAVGDVGRDGDRAIAESVGQSLDAVGAAGQQRDAVVVGGERAGRWLRRYRTTRR
jgi:hypothetical protein